MKKPLISVVIVLVASVAFGSLLFHTNRNEVDLRNNPSDGSERSVANGLMMVRVQPKDVSTTLYPADTVEALATCHIDDLLAAYFEGEAAVRALHRDSSLGDLVVVELVFGLALGADDIHLSRISAESSHSVPRSRGVIQER